MRTRKEIENAFRLTDRYVLLAILEVQLDIRDLLLEKKGLGAKSHGGKES
jgi:hypothetical protein